MGGRRNKILKIISTVGTFKSQWILNFYEEFPSYANESKDKIKITNFKSQSCTFDVNFDLKNAYKTGKNIFRISPYNVGFKITKKQMISRFFL